MPLPSTGCEAPTTKRRVNINAKIRRKENPFIFVMVYVVFDTAFEWSSVRKCHLLIVEN